MVIFSRVYADYLMPSRMEEYEKLLSFMVDSGYQIVSVIDFYDRLITGRIKTDDKILISRHDIDSDTKTAELFFQIEKRLTVNASYYFRKKTVDIAFMKVINEYGSEASYHFEEIADFSKKYKIHNSKNLEGKMSIIRSNFCENFRQLENALGFKMRSVAAHGDFANAKLGVPNTVITDDEQLRVDLGIELEAYDTRLISSFDLYIADAQPPELYKPFSPVEAIDKYNIICLLTHPKQWQVSYCDTTKENFIRFFEGAIWRFTEKGSR